MTDIGGMTDRLKDIKNLKVSLDRLVLVAGHYTSLSDVEIEICDTAFSRAAVAISIWEAVLSRQYEPRDAELDYQELELSDGLREALMTYWEGSQPDYSADDFYSKGSE